MKNKFTKWQRMTILVAIIDVCQQPRHPVFKTILTCLFTFLFFKLDLISYVCVFYLYMSLWTTGLPAVQVPEENIGSPGSGITGEWYLSCEYWQLNTDPSRA